MKNNLKNRKAFTLIELIVVMAILGVVTLAIISVFQFTNRSWLNANLREQQQYETRMAMNLVKEELGIAKLVIISDTIPAPSALPASGGYCYYDIVNHVLKLRTIDGATHDLIANLPDSISAEVQFVAVPVSSKLNTVQLNWDIGGYALITNVFIQNLPVDDRVTTTYDLGGNPSPGVFIEFS